MKKGKKEMKIVNKSRRNAEKTANLERTKEIEKVDEIPKERKPRGRPKIEIKV